MQEIKIYLDKDLKEEAGDDLEFDTITAGETSFRPIYIENLTLFPMEVKLSLDGKGIELSVEEVEIEPNDVKEINFKFKPELTIMQPIKATLTIKLSYTIR